MIIAPSVLSFDYDKFEEELAILNKSVEYIHFDVMDGHFVPNLSFGPYIMHQFRKNTNLFLDCHLMVDDPEYFMDVFANAGADGITFHYEAYDNIAKCDELIDKIHGKYLKAGISIKPNTPVDKIIPVLGKVDLVLIMSVEPGFGGQAFMPIAYEKIKQVKEYRDLYHLKYQIQVDGGVSDKNIRELLEAGADNFVAGSYIFKGDIQNNVAILRNAEK